MKSWTVVGIGAPPSPPPLGPNQGPISYSNDDENPFHWSSRSYTQFGRTLIVKTDGERIRGLRVDPRPSSSR